MQPENQYCPPLPEKNHTIQSPQQGRTRRSEILEPLCSLASSRSPSAIANGRVTQDSSKIQIESGLHSRALANWGRIGNRIGNSEFVSGDRCQSGNSRNRTRIFTLVLSKLCDWP